MRSIYLLVLAIFLVGASCKHETDTEAKAVNKFSDSTICKIHDLKDRRNTNELVSFLTNADNKYRNEAALALASVGDTAALPALIKAFNRASSEKDNPEFQLNIALAILQSCPKMSYSMFENLYETSTNNSVKQVVLWAMGRCQVPQKDNFKAIAQEILLGTSSELKLGLIKGYYEYALTGVWNIGMIETALEFAKTKNDDELRIYAANYLTRLTRIGAIEIESAFTQDPHNFQIQLIELIKHENEPLAKLHLVRALQIFKSQQKVAIIKEELDKENDYRVKLELINAVDDRIYFDFNNRLAELIGIDNEHIETAAATFFAKNGSLKDSSLYRTLYKKAKFWQAKNQLILARLDHRLLSDTNYTFLFKAVENAPNKWARAELYTILTKSNQLLPALMRFYKNETDLTAKTYCLDAICSNLIRFKDYYKTKMPADFNNLEKRVFEMAIGGINSDDGFMVYTAASQLQNDGYDNELIGSLNFNELLKKWDLPIFYETHLELQKLKMKVENKSTAGYKLPMPFNNPIDWDFVKTIAPKQELLISTAKGDIVIELDIENAPATVGYISKLANEGFYKDLIWHRVVRNFVVQGGDPFGNGTGSASGSLRSEHNFNEYKEGTVGIASAGKDTESCQFFITHNYTPHLNGRYTIIGYVKKGMDVVHTLQVNDAIHNVALVKN